MRTAILLFILSFSLAAKAIVRLPKLISDGMVLQRNTPLKFWGWADPGEMILVKIGQKEYKTKTNQAGKWLVMIPALSVGKPFTIIIKGVNEISIQNVVVGDVWLCSGQSNMELEMERVKYRYVKEVNTANYPLIRQFTVPDRYNFKNPAEDFEEGKWLLATPEHIRKFSAVAYFFAKEIHSKYKVPIGLINAALGGSPAEAWISEESIKKFPEAYSEALKFKDDQLIKEIEDKDRKISSEWYRQLNEKDIGYRNNWKQEAISLNDWSEMEIPGYWPEINAKPVNGVVWFRKMIEVPINMINKELKLELGRIVDADSVFINGIFCGSTGYQYPPRRYLIPKNTLKPGKNELVVRVISNSGRGGFVPDKPYELSSESDTVSLRGKWHYKVGATMDPLPSQTFIRWKPIGLYNAMIAPLLNFPLKGVIWYQGESNAARPKGYNEVMKTLIQDWRAKWQSSTLPFIFVQLANFMEPVAEPKESNWALLRNEQLQTLKVPNTGMAVAIDLGDWNDIHPENKKDVGYRLSLEARKLAYGEKNLLSRGPEYYESKINGDTIILSFRSTGGGLISRNNQHLQEFLIAGDDLKFYRADAFIRNGKVVVFSKEVVKPKYVRYAWANNPDKANLYNSMGLPASPFTTVK